MIDFENHEPEEIRGVMKLTLNPGQKICIQLADTDGFILISYNGDNDGHLTIKCDEPDSTGRSGVIYDEYFDNHSEDSEFQDMPWEPEIVSEFQSTYVDGVSDEDILAAKKLLEEADLPEYDDLGTGETWYGDHFDDGDE